LYGPASRLSRSAPSTPHSSPGTPTSTTPTINRSHLAYSQPARSLYSATSLPPPPLYSSGPSFTAPPLATLAAISNLGGVARNLFSSFSACPPPPSTSSTTVPTVDLTARNVPSFVVNSAFEHAVLQQEHNRSHKQQEHAWQPHHQDQQHLFQHHNQQTLLNQIRSDKHIINPLREVQALSVPPVVPPSLAPLPSSTFLSFSTMAAQSIPAHCAATAKQVFSLAKPPQQQHQYQQQQEGAHDSFELSTAQMDVSLNSNRNSYFQKQFQFQ